MRVKSKVDGLGGGVNVNGLGSKWTVKRGSTKRSNDWNWLVMFEHGLLNWTFFIGNN